MGIVVTIAMLLGLVVLRPTPWSARDERSQAQGFMRFTMFFLLFIGIWNFAWYGLRHASEFWGVVSLVSGLAMVAAAFFVRLKSREASGTDAQQSSFTASEKKWLRRLRITVVWSLAAFFLLYAVTLVQLNLGYSILR